MYIGKRKDNLIIVFSEGIEKKGLKSYCKLNLEEFANILKLSNNEYITTKDSNLIFNNLRIFIEYEFLIQKNLKDCKCKLVKFPKSGKIRLCSRGNTKHNYKNTLIIPNVLIDIFKKNLKNDCLELSYNTQPKAFDFWASLIDEKIKSI